MEWNNRGQSTPPNNAPANTNNGGMAPPHHPTMPPGKRKRDIFNSDRKWRIASVVLLFAITLLAVSVISYLAFFNSSPQKQSSIVDTSKYQAVFLNGGQVYFGKITSVNSGYTKLDDIYYLRVNQQVQPNGSSANGDVQLVKLGCELHGPQDQMVINSTQVVFWENLKADGQVSQAIAKYVGENPDGQKCDTTQATTGTNTNQPAAGTGTGTNNPNTTTKKP